MLATVDWIVVGVCLVLAFVPALFLARRASRGTEEFFASGRSAPWWLIGTSMVATTFSTDTPNLVTDFVRTGGVAKNWSWWAFLLTGMATVFFFARLWRRSGVLTDLEFYELRYSGAPAAVVRGFRAIYLGLFFNCVIMAAVTLAAVKIANIMLGWDPDRTLLVCGIASILFSAMSGLWGVMAADMIQFVIAMVGVFAASWYALDQPQVGGLDGLLSQMDPATLRLMPDFGDWEVALSVFIIPLTIQWWSVWYPGAEPGGGSYIAQRMLAARDERHSMGATLWFNIAHYALRPWPWVIVALCSMVVYPQLSDIQAAFPGVDPELLGHDIAYPAMLTLLPHGLLGLLVASLFSAYVSTMSTHLNWGSSYLVNDFYRRFIRPEADEKHYVNAARLVTGALMLSTVIITKYLDTASEAFALLLSVGAGTGLIYLLRWFWWRINAWSEIAAMLTSLAVAGYFLIARPELSDHVKLLLAVGLSTAVWMVVTFATAPADEATLRRFYERVRPAGPGWKSVRRKSGLAPSPDSMPQSLLGWVLGCLSVYSALFGAGSFLYGETTMGIVYLLAFAISAIALSRLLRIMWAAGDSAGH